MSGRQRIDLWLWRARITKSRALAADLVSAGNVRLVHNGQSRRLERPSVEVAPGDTILFSALFSAETRLRAVRVLGLPSRRGPPAEAATHYCELDADTLA